MLAKGSVMKLFLLGLLLGTTLACGGCEESFDATAVEESGASDTSHNRRAGTIRLTGSSTVGPLMNEIGKRFEQQHPEVRVEVQLGGSSRGVADTRRGLCDIGMISRATRDDESDLHAFAIARDGVGIILHADNAVAELTEKQIVEIYTGRIHNWKAVGGNDRAITVVHKAEGRSTLEVFTQFFGIANRDVRADVVIGDNQQGIKTVAGNPDAIGYVSIGTAEFVREMGMPIKLLPLAGVEASTTSVANGDFPISRTLNLVTSSPPQGLVKELIEVAQSTDVHDLIEELSFVPIANR